MVKVERKEEIGFANAMQNLEPLRTNPSVSREPIPFYVEQWKIWIEMVSIQDDEKMK